MKKRDENEIKKGSWKLLFKMMKETKPPMVVFTIAVVMSITKTLASLVVPLFTKNLVNSFSVANITNVQIAMLVSMFIIQALAGGLSIYMLNYVGQKIVAGIRDKLWRKLLKLPVEYYDANETGETISRMTNDTMIVKNLITEYSTSFFNGIISIVGSMVILLVLDWEMTLTMLVAVPLVLLVVVPLGRQIHKISKATQDETASFTAILSQVLSEIRLVKASSAEKNEYEKGALGISNLMSFGLKESKIQALISPLMSLVMMAILVLIIGYGGMRVSSGALTAGDLVAFILYLIQVIIPLGQVTTFFTQLQKTLGATERIMHTFEFEEEDHNAGLALGGDQFPIVLENVTFGYKPEEMILEDINIVAESGEITAIVGPSGSGKTTLFSLIERFYQPQVGTIKLGHVDSTTVNLKSWRRKIGYVSQESPLISGTIRENICYGLDEPISDEALNEAVKMAYADEFIQALPEGFETQVGERGVKLSGGQRQRIAIARALLRKPQILLLDEATSSLDSHSEVVVQKALNNLMYGRTTLVIAHRMSTIVDASKIIFIDKGRVTGCGTHEKLLATHALYRKFATQQLRLNQQTLESIPLMLEDSLVS
ncbi:ABC transporter ATP-binding protein [Fusibacter ferrireducens]|uniref:ABC transporter ATP-binding protein n=1 Tax=Fusibacter ferrireducens TaxID=2785058 RepID=A0ABR9ZWY8_9FIRM|nr:ABC transporter ATP-binding protein [Fusibacter ferrireducens]MBF4694471.1 ABC transporter ATP-binding protein [Fusibacter ferrireducens]